MVTSEYYFPSSDKKTLIHVNQWTPVSAPLRGMVQIAHGVAEYGLRYAPFARFLCAHGFLVTAHDHLGHGLSVADGAPRDIFQRVEELKAAGLTVPETVGLMYELRKEGLDVPLDTLSDEECAQALYELLQSPKEVAYESE